MSTHIAIVEGQGTEQEQFFDSYAENLTFLLDMLDVVAEELAQVGDYQAASFFTGLSRAVSGFAACHFPAARLIAQRTQGYS